MTLGICYVSELRRLCVDVCSEGGTPDTIPNSAVKPFSADDTWSYPGKVGRHQHRVFLCQSIPYRGMFFLFFKSLDPLKEKRNNSVRKNNLFSLKWY